MAFDLAIDEVNAKVELAELMFEAAHAALKAAHGVFEALETHRGA